MELLKSLCEINGCSGNENKVAELIAESIKDFVTSVKTDALGNLIAHKKGNGKKLMFVAHMDECGFFTTISDENDIKVATVGDIDVKSLSNTVIEFENGACGYLHGKSSDKISDYSVKMIDEKADFTGVTASYKSNMYTRNGYVVSKALSSRACCFVLIELIRNIKSNLDLYFVFTVKKNIGLKGAKVVGYNIAPDYTVVIDGCNAENPCAIVKDKNYIIDNDIKEKLERCGFDLVVKKDIATEGAAIQVTGSGIKTAVIALPIKCINSANEMVSISHIYETVESLKKFAKEGF